QAGVYAVVPCQWRRIIGSYSGLTRGNLKKDSVRSISRHNVRFLTI
ncbi:hypothetical protein EC848_4599, partial [Enterobacter sp. BIGb0359]